MGGPYYVNGFGMRLHPVLHVYRMHYGVDIINDVGTPMCTQRVTVWCGSAGRTQGGLGVLVETQPRVWLSPRLYAHLSQVLVPAGTDGEAGRTHRAGAGVQDWSAVPICTMKSAATA